MTANAGNHAAPADGTYLARANLSGAYLSGANLSGANLSGANLARKAWLSRDPKQQIPGRDEAWALKLWWHRNFYPDVSMIINDLHAKGLLPAGSYLIDIDW